MSSLRLSLPTRDPSTEITIGLRLDRTISSIKAFLIKKFEVELSPVPPGSSGDGWVVALCDENKNILRLLPEDTTLNELNIKPPMRVEMKHRHYATRVSLLDSSLRTILLDRTQTVAEILVQLSKKFSVEEYVASFGLRRVSLLQRTAVNIDAPSDVDPYQPAWLSPHLPLHEQSVLESDELLFSKRFLGSWDLDDRSNPQNFQLAFLEARTRYLGLIDERDVSFEICIELSSLLLLLAVNRAEGKTVAAMTGELASTVLPLFWRKKADWRENLSKLESNYMDLRDATWAAEIKNVQHRFTNLVIQLPQCSTTIFHAPLLSFSNDSSVEDGSIVVGPFGIDLRSSRPSATLTQLAHWADRAKGPYSTYRVHMPDVIQFTADGNHFSVCFSIYSQAQVTLSAELDHAKDLIDTINSYRSLSTMQSSSPLPTPYPNFADQQDFFNVLFSSPPSNICESASLAIEALTRIRTIFDAVARLDQKIQLREPNNDGTPSALTISQWFSQAAIHLKSIVSGSATLCKSVLQSSTAASVGDLLNWCMALDSLVKCLLRAVQFGYSNSQTLGGIASNVTFICIGIMACLSRFNPGSFDHNGKVEIVVLDRSLSAACAALDLALRGQLSDDSTCVSLLFICSDIESTLHSIFHSCQKISESSEVDRQSLEWEVSKCRSVTYACLPLVAICAFVDCSEAPDLRSRVQTLLDSLSSSVKSLLSHLMDFSSTTTDIFEDAVASVRWSWGCLDHSVRIYSMIAASSEPPWSETDPMLPVPLFGLASAVYGAFSRHRDGTAASDAMDTAVGSVIRTLAKMVSLQKTPDIVSVSASLQSSFRRSRRPPKRNQRIADQRLFWSLRHLSICIDAFYRLIEVPVGRNDRLRFEFRLLLSQTVLLRSLLNFSCTVSSPLVEFEYVSKHVEELDVLLHELFPILSSAFQTLRTNIPIDSLFATSLSSNFDQIRDHLDSIISAIRSSDHFLGPFSDAVNSLISGLLARWDWCRSSLQVEGFFPFDEQSSTLLSPNTGSELPLRRKSMSLTLRSADRMSFRKGFLSPSVSSEALASPTQRDTLRRASSPDGANMSPISEKNEENVEIASEESLLSLLHHMVLTGEVADLNMTFKDALDLFLITCPYWTSTETLSAKISTALRGDSSSSIDEHVAARAAVALSKLLHFHPDAVHDPGTRLVMNDMLAFFKRIEFENSGMLETAIKDSIEALARCHNLKELQFSINAGSSGVCVDLLSIDLDELATQMTLAEELYFKAVNMPDFLKTAWTKTDNALSLWIDHTNSTARWIATRIIQTQQRKDRVKLIARLLKLAQLLRARGNFATMITVFLGLSTEAVTRLKKTWDSNSGVLRSRFQLLENSILPLNNFSGYREELKRANLPCIPYMAVLTRDLVNLEEVMAAIKLTAPPGSLLNGNLVNISHLNTLRRIISNQFGKFRRASYQGTRNKEIWSELFHPAAFGALTEKEQLALADALEPEKRKIPRQIIVPLIPLRSGLASNTSPQYGIRSDLRRSSSSPSSIVPKLRPLWVEHMCKCAAELEAVQARFSQKSKFRLSQTTSALTNAFNEMILSYSSSSPTSESRADSEPTKPMQRSKTFADGDSLEIASISSSMSSQDKILSELLPSSCTRAEWKKAAPIGDAAKKDGILVQNTPGFHALVIAIILAILEYFRGGTGRIVGNRVGTVVSGNSSVAAIRYTVTADTPPTDVEPDSSFIMGHLSPSQLQLLKHLQGTVEFSIGSTVSLASLDLMLPLRSLDSAQV